MANSPLLEDEKSAEVVAPARGEGVARHTEKSNSFSIRSSILLDYLRLTEALQIDGMALLDRTGIDRQCASEPERMIPIRNLVELFELTAMISGVSDFGLRLAELRGLPDLGPVNLILREEVTVRDAIHRLIELIYLHSDAANLELIEDEYPILKVVLMGCDMGNCHQAMDASVAQTTSLLRWLMGDMWSPDSICFTHSQPLSSRKYREFFRCPIDFLHEFNAIVLNAGDLDRKLTNASPVFRRHLEVYLHQISSTNRDTYDKRVARIISQTLPLGQANAEHTAKRLDTTTRTLNRRLQAYDVNFSQLLQKVRVEMVTQYIYDGDRAISDIVWLVGFSSLSSFSTWFKQTFGCPPREWRKRNRVLHY